MSPPPEVPRTPAPIPRVRADTSSLPADAIATDPVVVGALGGSGTRVVARILRHVGIFMGSHLNDAEDSLPFITWYDAWARPLLQARGSLTGAARETAEAMFATCLAHHLMDLPEPGAPWGVKVPRTILFLPWWIRLFPRLRFVHLIRSGLDMAYSADTNQLRLYGDLVLSRAERRQPPRVQAMAYWSRVNLAAATFAEAHLGERYLRLRFEDLCAEPARAVARVFDFLGLTEPPQTALAAAAVTPPTTIGRWRERPATEVWELMRAGRAALERFSYWEPPAWDALCRTAGARPRWDRMRARLSVLKRSLP